MNYLRIYNELIESRKIFTSFSATNYWEKHHIIPKCIGGSDDEYNFVLLTAREHYIAHWLLIKIYPKDKKLKMAFTGIVFNKDKRRLTGIQYEHIKNIPRKHTEETRQKMSESQLKRLPFTEEHRRNMSISGSGRIFTEEHKRNISNALTGLPINPKCIYIRTEETRLKASESAKNRPPMTEETRQKMSESHIGILHSEETKRKIGDSNLKNLTEEGRNRIIESNKNRKMSQSQKDKYSCTCNKKRLVNIWLKYFEDINKIKG